MTWKNKRGLNSFKAINDIEFTVNSMDKDAGFIAAERGKYPFEKSPPRLSIMIKEVGGKVHNFMIALNQNLNM
jgi:hypothetical protein